MEENPRGLATEVEGDDYQARITQRPELALSNALESERRERSHRATEAACVRSRRGDFG